MGVVLKRTFPHNLALEIACGSVCNLHDSIRKLSAEGCGCLVSVGVGLGEGDELVEELLNFLPESVAMVRQAVWSPGGERKCLIQSFIA